MSLRHFVKTAILAVLCLNGSDLCYGRTATVTGRIVDQAKNPLVGANVTVLGTQLGASTDSSGRYTIRDLPPGQCTLRASSVGYNSVERRETAIEDAFITADFVLTERPAQMNAVDVTTGRRSSGIALREPSSKEIIPVEELRGKSTDASVLSALATRTGLTVRPSELCGASGVRMQGLEPSYTEVTVDGMPIFGGLGAMYGLEGVSVEDVSEVEVERGSGSNESGSGAVAGDVNLVSRKPSDQSSFRVNLTGGDTWQHTIAVNGSHPVAKLPARLSLTYSSQPGKVDRDHDGITDTPEYRRFNMNFGVASGTEDDGLRMNARIYEEHRFAGETRWTTHDRGSSEVYGRDILTHRQELTMSFAGEGSRRATWSVKSAFVSHLQDSWYGTTRYNAVEREALAQVNAGMKWNYCHTTNMQTTFDYNDYHDDLRLTTPTDLRYRIPGVMAQHEWSPISEWTVQGGARVEYYKSDGLVVTPRGAILWQPASELSVRLTTGAGFRPVSIFSLDESVQAGFDHIEVPKTLKPEKSLANSIAVNRQWLFKASVLTLDASLFYTHIPHKVILSFDRQPGTTTYINADDAYSRGVELQADWKHISGWSLKAGASRADMRYEDAQVWHQEPEENLYTGTASLLKNWEAHKLTAELSAQVFGPRVLPENRQRSRTSAFALVDVGLSRSWGQFTLSGMVKNALNWTQPDSPYLRDPQTGRLLFDSLLLYGPLLGRTYYVSLSYAWPESHP
jgi:outer membrane receptor for ferrienterochelin and colicins